MEKIPKKSFYNCHSEERIANNRNLESNHAFWEMSTTAITLRNISSMLFEQNTDEKNDVCEDKAAFQAMEISFYEILAQKHSSSSSDLQHPNAPQIFPHIFNQIQNESLPSLEFKRGMEEGMKFLPSIDSNRSTMDLKVSKSWSHSKRKNHSDLVQRMTKKGENGRNSMMLNLKSKRHANSEALALVEGQKCKINVLYYKNQDVLIDKVFLLHEEHYAKEVLRLRVIMQNGTSSCSKKGIHDNSVDLKSLLIHCSQAISINDGHVDQLLKQIKKHSSPYGNGMQRIAHIFVNGLEARLNGTSTLYKPLVPTMTEFLSCFRMYLLSCPTLMISPYLANYTILNAARKASKLHIIDLGADFGFNWAVLIHELSKRIGGPPKLRITNIQTPASSYILPGELIELVRQKLEIFSRSYGVPLEYRGLATKWDEICIDDLSIEKDEMVFVNSYFGFENLRDEADVMNSPTNQVLDIIRRIRPHVFIQSIRNGSLNSSFFVDRFKQVLNYTSAMFDICDATLPHNNKQRWFLENILFGPAMIKLIADEGPKRCVGAETYKQYHTRNSRVGFEQLPLDHAILKRIKDKVREVYHESFFIDDDKGWLLSGWKGRVMYAVSTWQPKQT